MVKYGDHQIFDPSYGVAIAAATMAASQQKWENDSLENIIYDVTDDTGKRHQFNLVGNSGGRMAFEQLRNTTIPHVNFDVAFPAE